MGDQINWTDPNNWSSHAVPGPADDVTINFVSNANLHISSGTQSINSLVCDDELFLFSGVTLQVATTVTLGSNSAEDFVNRGLNLEGATLLGGAYSSASNSSAAVNVIAGNNTFNGVTVSGGVVNDGGTLTVLNNLTMSNGVLNLAGVVNFGDATHAAGSLLGTANVTSQGGGSFLQNVSGLTAPTARSRLPPVFRFSQAISQSESTSSTGTIVNQGSITGSQQFIVNSGLPVMSLGSAMANSSIRAPWMSSAGS